MRTPDGERELLGGDRVGEPGGLESLVIVYLMLQAHAGRVPLVHLKDKAKGTPVQYDEGKVPKEAFKEVGRGEIDYAAFLPAAAKAGAPLDSLRVSHQAIEALTT